MRKLLPLLLLTSQVTLGAVMSSYHGEGVPLHIGPNQYGQQYRQEFLEEYAITPYEQNGVTFYDNNKIGLGLVKTGNNDAAFRDILNVTSPSKKRWASGQDFIQRMKEYTYSYGCIPKIVSVSHGWRSDNKTGDVHGLSGQPGNNGLYATYDTAIHVRGSATVYDDLRNAINNGEVEFCNKCLIQLYACNVSVYFGKILAQVSNCQVIIDTGKASPKFQSSRTELDRFLQYNANHYWMSSPGTHIENRNKTGAWIRVTPFYNEQEQKRYLSIENLGSTYIAI